MKKESLVFGAGCFWGVQDLIRRINGVITTQAGYCGGTLAQPTYSEVSNGSTGHAEAVMVKFDQEKISRAELLDLFFKMHNPTTKNQQGGDIGSQYRSVIFVSSKPEQEEAEQAILRAQKIWKGPIMTQLEELGTFYPAEEDHQDYLQKNPSGYTCHYWRD